MVIKLVVTSLMILGVISPNNIPCRHDFAICDLLALIIILFGVVLHHDVSLNFLSTICSAVLNFPNYLLIYFVSYQFYAQALGDI